MNKEQFEKELDEKLASLKEEMMKKFEEQEDEFPKYGDRYYYLTASGNIQCTTWNDDEFDRNVSARGNRFRTWEESEFERERGKVIAELEKFSKPNDKEWNEGYNYFVLWDYRKNNIGYNINVTVKRADIYFESLRKAKQAVESVGKDRVKKYYLRVEE